jgi:hypothetical protein
MVAGPSTGAPPSTARQVSATRTPTLVRKPSSIDRSGEAYPVDPDFPQLPIATNPDRMLEVFRTHLQPVSGTHYQIEACTPFRFRCRQSNPRCVLQYTFRILDPGTGHRWDQWVTGIVYADAGEAELIWQGIRASDPHPAIPHEWRTFEPVTFIPELQMLVQVFPYDRRLPNLCRLLDGAVRDLEPLLTNRLGPGHWQVEDRRMEPTRYRAELGAALRYTIQVRDTLSARHETIRCYLKAYRDERGADTFRLVQSLAQEVEEGHKPYSVIKPVAYLDELRTLAIEEAPGVSLNQLLLRGVGPAEVLGLVARAVAAFNRDHLPIPRREGLEDQLEDVGLASDLVRWACPEVREEVRAITDAISTDLEDVPSAPIHGDLKADHIFLSDDRVTFIDLDSTVLGDPVRDAAHLFAYLAAGVGLGSTPVAQARAIAAQFAEEYFRLVPGSWRNRFPIHCAGALLEVASGIFRRQEVGWPEKAREVVALADRIRSGGFG